MSQSLFPISYLSPAHLFLLSRFLEPLKLKDLTRLIDWELVLGDRSETVVAQLLASGELEYVDEGESLAARMKELRLADLRELARERDLPASGRKAELVTRLIEADPAGMETAGLALCEVQCTERGRSAIERYLMTSPRVSVDGTASTADTQPSAASPVAEIGGALSRLPTDIPGDESAAAPSEATPRDVDIEAAKAHVKRARSLGNKADYDQALQALNQAAELNPRYALAYFWKGVIYERLGQYTQALVELNQAVSLNPNPATFYALRGDAYRGLCQWALAVREYDAAIERDPQLVLAHHNRGIAHEGLGDYVQALTDYDRAIQLKPESAASYFGRGVSFEQIGDLVRARDEFQIVIQLSSDATLLSRARERLQKVMPPV